MAAIDPTIMEIGADILLSNINAPGIDQIAERKRLQMVNAGLIPPTQLKEDEKKMLAQKQQSGNDMSAIDKANLQIAAAQEADIQGKNAERAAKVQIEQQKLQLKQMELQMRSQLENERLAQAQQKQMIDVLAAINDQVKSQAETLKLIREAMGADAVVSPASSRAFEEQSQELVRSINQQNNPTGGIPA